MKKGFYVICIAIAALLAVSCMGGSSFSGAATGEHQIDVANINKGVYFLKVVADGETAINKLLIQ